MTISVINKLEIGLWYYDDFNNLNQLNTAH